MAANNPLLKLWEAAIIRLRKRIEDPTRLMKHLGVLVVGESKRAFQDQALGEIKWPARYPNQSEPMVNIAGALMDLDRGPSIKSRRYERRPALEDTGVLRRSMTQGRAISMEGKKTVVVGTSREGAFDHQNGGWSELPITGNMRANLDFLVTKAEKQMNDPFLEPATKRTANVFPGGKRHPAKKYMQPRELAALRKIDRKIENIDTLTTEVNRRPFLGITDALADRMVRSIQDDFSPRTE